MDLDVVSVHKNGKRELGQYPAILTSRLVNNIYMLFSLSALLDIVGKMQKYMDEELFSCGILLIYVKLLMPLTTIFCCINYIVMECVVS